MSQSLTVDGMEAALEIVRTYCQQKEDEYQRVIGREHFREQALSLKDAKLAGEVIAHRIETAIKAVSLRAQAPAQPVDSVTVPIVPTEEMLIAGCKAEQSWAEPYEPETESGVPIECGMSQADADEINKAMKEGALIMWNAMIAAAPVSAPAREQGEAVAWQYRYVDPEEGPGNWINCTKSDVAIVMRRSDHESRELYAAPASAPQAVELERYNVALAEESRILRNVIDDLVEAFDASADMDEMDGPEYQEASTKLEAAINAARPHTEQAITQKAIDLAALPKEK